MMGLGKEIRWVEVEGDRQGWDEFRVNSDVSWEENDSVDVEEEDFRDLDWDIWLAANNFSGEFEVENDDGVLYVTVQDEYLYSKSVPFMMESNQFPTISRKKGFGLEKDLHAPLGQRFRLRAVPFSKNITFGVVDVKELISILADSQGECSMIGSYRMDTADSVCPPRVRAMLASRACRSSVMIGTSLSRIEMQKIVKHLADLKSQWNCPHGRPTMRHLVDLTTLHRRLNSEDEGLS